MCGIIGCRKIPKIFQNLVDGLYNEQHRGGEEGTGLLFSDGTKFISPAPHKTISLIQECATQWPGKHPEDALLGIGFTRYGTSGNYSDFQNIQPFLRETQHGPIAVVHNGDTPDYGNIREDFQTKGAVFSSTSDSELITHYIARQPLNSIEEAVKQTIRSYPSAFALIIATPNKLIGCRDPLGYRPLCLGECEGGYILASESCALDVISNASYVRDIEPGEMVVISDKGVESTQVTQRDNYQQCIFENIYLARPDSRIFNRWVHEDRVKLGKQVAREVGWPEVKGRKLKKDEFVVFGVPDSATIIAEGYAEELGVTTKIVLVRHHYVGRTFMGHNQAGRDNGVRLKFNPLRKRISGKWCVNPHNK